MSSKIIITIYYIYLTYNTFKMANNKTYKYKLIFDGSKFTSLDVYAGDDNSLNKTLANVTSSNEDTYNLIQPTSGDPNYNLAATNIVNYLNSNETNKVLNGGKKQKTKKSKSKSNKTKRSKR